VCALVADDNLHNRDVLSQILESAGIQVMTAENGSDALSQIGKKVPDIVFMDLRMPVMGGSEALKAIRKEFDEDIKVVAISASAFEHQVQTTEEMGFDAFVPKPFQIEIIFDCLRRLLKVEFVEKEDATDADHTPAHSVMELSQILLPKSLIDHLKQAAERASITDLKSAVAELSAHGKPGEALMQHLQPYLNKYDMENIQTLLDKIHHAPNS
jgi:CheY-like chemotaxis protein